MSDRDTKVKIITQADNKGTTAARDAMGRFVKSTDQAGAASKKAGKAAEKAGRDMEHAAKRPHASMLTSLNLWRRLRMVILGAVAATAAMIREAVVYNIQMARAWTMMGGGIKQFMAMRREVTGLSKDLGLAKSELAGGLYQALSAGVPKDNVISFLAKAGKVAVADGSSVSTAVDGITTILNAFKIEAKDTGKVVDLMFQTVANGKTTFGELAQQISVAAPIAATLGVKIEDVLAAVATLTKQGTPTAVAMTQIRAAMLATNDVLGDGWAKTYNLAEAFQAVADKAGGSQNKLRELVGRVEAMNGVLGLTGQNAKMAKADIDAMANSAGALDNAFSKVDQFRHWHKLWQDVRAIVTDIGTVLDNVLKPAVDAISQKLSEWEGKTKFFDNLEAKLAKMRDDAAGLWTAITEGGEGGTILNGLKDMLIGGLRTGGEKAVEFLLEKAPVIGDLIGAAAKRAFDGSKGGEMSVAVDQLRSEGMLNKEGRDKGISRAEQRELIRERTRQIHVLNLAAEGKSAAAVVAGGGGGQAQYDRGRDAVKTAVAMGRERNDEKQADAAARKWEASKQATYTMRTRQQRDSSGRLVTDAQGNPVYKTQQFEAPSNKYTVGETNKYGYQITGKNVETDRDKVLRLARERASKERADWVSAKGSGDKEAIAREGREYVVAGSMAKQLQTGMPQLVNTIAELLSTNKTTIDQLLKLLDQSQNQSDAFVDKVAALQSKMDNLEI